MSVREQILLQLTEIEQEHQVRIPIANESGSRAWGFAYCNMGTARALLPSVGKLAKQILGGCSDAENAWHLSNGPFLEHP